MQSGSKSGGGQQTMRNVTIRQLIKECREGSDEFKVDGVDLTTFFIVGRIVSRVNSAANIKFKIDDGTGAMDVLHHNEDSNELINNVAEEWVVNAYVRVCGHMRSMDGKRSMTAFRIRLVKDFNEVTYHNLQCIFQHLHFTKGAAAPPGAAAPVAGGSRVHAAGTAQQGGMTGNKLQMDVLSVFTASMHLGTVRFLPA